jgi:hypothetical protein
MRLKVRMVLSGTHPSALQAVNEKKNLSVGRFESEK